MAVRCPDLLTSICHCSFDGNPCQVAKDFRFSSAGDSSEVLAMLLAIDVGNTQITIGLYDGGQLGARWELGTRRGRLPDEYGILVINLFPAPQVGPGEVDR